jgi:hypothetical protein
VQLAGQLVARLQADVQIEQLHQLDDRSAQFNCCEFLDPLT